MDIIFSRHAKRRIKLYCLSEDRIRILLAKEALGQGNNEIIIKYTSASKKVKIVMMVEEDKVTVITAYPLKRGRKK